MILLHWHKERESVCTCMLKIQKNTRKKEKDFGINRWLLRPYMILIKDYIIFYYGVKLI